MAVDKLIAKRKGLIWVPVTVIFGLFGLLVFLLARGKKRCKSIAA